MCQHFGVNSLRVVGVLGALFVPLAGLPLAAHSTAQPCPDVQVVFARGTNEPPGVGIVGQAFADSLSSRVGGRSVAVSAVNYPASDNYVSSAASGSDDARAQIQDVVASCPSTKLVLGGYSLGAAATDMVLALPIPIVGFKSPLPSSLNDKIAAVALFGNGIQWVGPISAFNPVFRDRTIELCHAADPICNPADPDTWQDNWPDHLGAAYIKAGMVNQAADFVAARL